MYIIYYVYHVYIIIYRTYIHYIHYHIAYMIFTLTNFPRMLIRILLGSPHISAKFLYIPSSKDLHTASTLRSGTLAINSFISPFKHPCIFTYTNSYNSYIHITRLNRLPKTYRPRLSFDNFGSN